MSALTQSTLLGAKVVVSKASVAKRTNVVTRAGQYDSDWMNAYTFGGNFEHHGRDFAASTALPPPPPISYPESIPQKLK